MKLSPRPCKRCKCDIPVERLEAIPGTVLCVKCSQEVGGEWEYSFTNENTAKVGSLEELRRCFDSEEAEVRRTVAKVGHFGIDGLLRVENKSRLGVRAAADREVSCHRAETAVRRSLGNLRAGSSGREVRVSSLRWFVSPRWTVPSAQARGRGTGTVHVPALHAISFMCMFKARKASDRPGESSAGRAASGGCHRTKQGWV